MFNRRRNRRTMVKSYCQKVSIYFDEVKYLLHQPDSDMEKLGLSAEESDCRNQFSYIRRLKFD